MVKSGDARSPTIGNQANDRIEADAIVRAGHDEGRVEQLGGTTQRRQPRLLCCCERSEPDDSHRANSQLPR